MIDTPARVASLVFLFAVLVFPSRAAAQSTDGWTVCADEGGFCAFAGAKEVRYGANDIYTYKTLSDGTACTNTSVRRLLAVSFLDVIPVHIPNQTSAVRLPSIASDDNRAPPTIATISDSPKRPKLAPRPTVVTVTFPDEPVAVGVD